MIQLVEGGAYVQDDRDLVFVTPGRDGAVAAAPGDRAGCRRSRSATARLVLVANRVIRAYE